MTLEEFIQRIPNFEGLTPGDKIPYFGYYLIEIGQKEGFTATDVKNCFKQLRVVEYSNISSYLSFHAKRKEYIRVKQGYVLERSTTQNIAQNLGEIRLPPPSDSLFPLSLFEGTRTYLINIAKQAIQCYDFGIYDASLVMIRKLIETLIIELFEKYSISDRIKNAQTNNFYFLSDLIPILIKEEGFWNISRNARKALPDIKEKGDMSAHNRRYNATKSDLDKISNGLRIVIEEIIHIIDYQSLNKQNKALLKQ